MSQPTFFDPPRIESEAPSQSASETSRKAAECISDPFRRESHRRLMWVMGEWGKGWMSQWQLAQAADLPINVVCARIPELEPIWVQRSKGACRSHVKPSLKVDGFMLTPAGFQRLTMAYVAAQEGQP